MAKHQLYGGTVCAADLSDHPGQRSPFAAPQPCRQCRKSFVAQCGVPAISVEQQRDAALPCLRHDGIGPHLVAGAEARMIVEMIVEIKNIEEGSCARFHHHMADIRVECRNFCGGRSFVAEMSGADVALKIGSRHRRKTCELAALRAEQASCSCGDCCAVQATAQLCTDAAAGA